MVQLVGKSELYDDTIAADELEPEKIKLTSIGVSTTNSTSVVWTATRMRAQKVGCERCSLSLFKCSWRSNRSRISRIHEPSFGQPRAIATSACRPGPGGGCSAGFLIRCHSSLTPCPATPTLSISWTPFHRANACPLLTLARESVTPGESNNHREAEPWTSNARSYWSLAIEC